MMFRRIDAILAGLLDDPRKLTAAANEAPRERKTADGGTPAEVPGAGEEASVVRELKANRCGRTQQIQSRRIAPALGVRPHLFAEDHGHGAPSRSADQSGMRGE